MFPNTLYITSPTEGKLFFINNDQITKTVSMDKEGRAILVSQNKVSVYVANKATNMVSQFRQDDGSHIRDIPVGKAPIAMCEDANGNIYVANYGSNSVSKLTGGAVVKTILTGNGPYGLVVDEANNLYVACSSENKVYKFSNDIRTDVIDVGISPRGMVCDPLQNVWTANYGSNTISKITKGKKILDVTVGRSPIALTSDSSGNIYVANYFDGSVTVVPFDGSENVTIPVGKGPTAIAVDQYDNVYVTSGLGTDVQKIVDRAVNGTIEIGNNPAGFGDFTGCATYNIFHDPANPNKPSGGAPDGGWKLQDLSQDIRDTLSKVDVLDQAINGDTSTIPTKQEVADTYLAKADAETTYAKTADLDATYVKTADADTKYVLADHGLDDYAKTADIEKTYLKSADAAKTYSTSDNIKATYLAKADAETTYVKADHGLDDYAKTADIAKTYLATADAETTFAKAADLTTAEDTANTYYWERSWGAKPTANSVATGVLMVPFDATISEITMMVASDPTAAAITITGPVTVQLQSAPAGAKAAYTDITGATASLTVDANATTDIATTTPTDMNIDKNTRIIVKCTEITAADAITDVIVRVTYTKRAATTTPPATGGDSDKGDSGNTGSGGSTTTNPDTGKGDAGTKNP